MSQDPASKLLDAAAVSQLGRRLCNWTRWGAQDQRGTLNHISPRHRIDAAGLVRDGQVLQLGIPFDRSGPITASPRRFNPLHFMMILPEEDIRAGGVGMADDVIMMPLQCGTQWDSLAHVAHNGLLYGGRSAATVTSRGAETNDIRQATGIATRGVLLDVAGQHGDGSLPAGYAIEAVELERLERQHGVRVGEGDILLVRTGHLEHCRKIAWEGYSESAPGLAMSTLEWLHERGIAGVATDTYAVEVKPYQAEGHASPFHTVALVYMGLLMGEIFALDELAAACHSDSRYDFLFVAPALQISGGVGSPINPYAIR